MIANIVFTSLFTFSALTDALTGYVYDIASIAMIISCIPKFSNLSSFQVQLMLLLLLAMFISDRKEKYLGRGDYLVLASSFIYTGENLNKMILLSCTLALIYMLLRRTKSVRFIPFLFLGFILTVLFK